MAHPTKHCTIPSTNRLQITYRVITLCAVSLSLFSMPVTATPVYRASVRLMPPVQQTAKNGATANESDVRTLEQGTPVERELTGGGVHSYLIKATTEQFFSVTVDQRGIDVVMTLFAPDGKQVTEVDSPNGKQGPEVVSVVANTSGDYRLEVRSSDKVAAGQYEVKIEALRDATPQDKTENLAAMLIAAKTEEARAALLSREKELMTKELLHALKGQGKRFEPQHLATALTSYLLAQRVAEQIGDRAETAAILGSIGSVYIGLGNNAQSLTYSRQSLAAFEALGQKVEAARALNQIGIAHHNSGNFTEALEHYQKSLVIRQEVGDKAKIAETVRNIGNIHTVQGRYDEALEYYQQSLTFIAASGDDSGLASALNNIGVVYENQGNLAEAMALYRKSLTIRERLGNKLRIAIALNNIGSIYRMQGNYQQALDYLQRSLGIRQSLGDKFGISSSLNNIGAIYREEGDSTLALKHFQQSLAVAGEMGNKGLIAILLNEIGNISYNTNDYLKASECYEKSLAISEASGIKVETAKSLNGIARVSYAEGKHRQASESAERAATIARQINTRHQLSAALTIAGMAYRAIGQPDRARAAFAEAINVVEFLRSNVGGQESRTSYFATAQQPYELYIDLLMQLHKQRPSEGHDALALQTNERARARSLLEALSEARADIRQGVDTELLRHERGLQQRLNATAERHVRLLSGKHTEEQAATVKKEIDALTAEFQDVQAQIRQKSPRYAALTQPAPLTLREIQTDVLDADTLLLEYALGEERSYLWAVTPTSITSYELPKRAEIDTAARRVYELLSDHKLWTTTGDAAGAQYAAAAARLSQMVLAPAVAQIQGKRLVIVADGGLQYVPFAALPAPALRDEGRGMRDEKQKAAHSLHPSALIPHPLIVEHEMVSLPSASTLSALRRETANRQRAPKSVAVLADPVFEKTDERVATAIAVRSGSTRSGATETASNRAENPDFQSANSRLLLERAFGLQPPTGDTTGTMREALRVPRLPFTRREAEAILAVTPTREGMKALDFRASRQTAISPGLAQHRIVHFATHGLLNSEHPELSGVVLSLVDEHGKPVDGFLRLHEIYNLNLPAEMVVLSACQTALGKEVKGEGLVGLTRGFMYAGAPRVVASLWKVNDVATAELMKRFYSGMLKENLRPPAALRAAKITIWKQKRWRSPYYWAAFELQGEWK